MKNLQTLVMGLEDILENIDGLTISEDDIIRLGNIINRFKELLSEVNVEAVVKPTCVNCFYATTTKNDDVISSICHCQISPICWMQEKEIKYGIHITRMRECDGCNHFKKASSV